MKSAVKFVVQRLFREVCLGAGLFLFPLAAHAVQSVPLAWNPSNDPNVIGYRIYYGGTSHSYTNSVTVGNVTNTIIAGLQDGVTYYFAAKGYDSFGDESPFSNETSMSSTAISANGEIAINASSLDNSTGRYTFSLASGTPAGVSINPATGFITWVPGQANASSTNYIRVVIADSQNPGVTTTQTIMVAVGDYFSVNLGNVVAQAGQNVVLPLQVFASEGATSVSFALTWSGHHFSNAALSFNSPAATGTISVQGTNLVIQIQNLSVGTGSNNIGQLTLFATAGQMSSHVPITLLWPQATKVSTANYNNASCSPAVVTIIGTQPLIDTAPTMAGTARVLTVYGNPQAVYSVESATSLSGTGNWQPLTSFTQTNLIQSVALNDNSPVAFYRLVQQ